MSSQNLFLKSYTWLDAAYDGKNEPSQRLASTGRARMVAKGALQTGRPLVRARRREDDGLRDGHQLRRATGQKPGKKTLPATLVARLFVCDVAVIAYAAA